MSPSAGSSSRASPGALSVGDEVGAFRIERLLGRGSAGPVYEATQLSLNRRVALRLLDPGASPGRARLAASLHHPNIVPTYEVGDWNGVTFVASRYVRGRTLDALIEDRRLSPPARKAIVASVADALDAVHKVGLAHGAMAAHNVLVDSGGMAHLTDLGLAASACVEDDRRALAALAAEVETGAARRGSRGPVALAVCGLVAVAAAAVGVVDGGGERDASAQPAPPVAARALPIGSDLSPGPSDSLGCGPDPGPNTPACTLGQSALGGRPMTVHRAGVIRSWAVRGAHGELSLQVIGRRGGNEYLRGFTPLERVPSASPHVFSADLAVARGDRIGVLLAPGATIGARPGAGRSSALRWEGTLDFRPRPQGFRRIPRELLLRSDIRYDVPRAQPLQLTGRRAAAAGAGSRLAEAVIQDLQGGAVRVVLVRTRAGIAVDAVRDRRRLARIRVPDAHPSGQVSEFDSHCGYRRGVCLRWLNHAEGAPVVHVYRLTRDGRAFGQLG